MHPRLSIRLLPTILIASATTGCIVDITSSDDTKQITDGSNIPVVGVSADGLGYALRARGFTSAEQYGPVVHTKSASVVTAVIGYTAGSAVIEIRDASSAVVMQQTITNNLAQASTVVRGTPPFKVSLSFQHFSGAFSLAVGPADSTRTP
jgi:hypothetical protein